MSLYVNILAAALVQRKPSWEHGLNSRPAAFGKSVKCFDEWPAEVYLPTSDRRSARPCNVLFYNIAPGGAKLYPWVLIMSHISKKFKNQLRLESFEEKKCSVLVEFWCYSMRSNSTTKIHFSSGINRILIIWSKGNNLQEPKRDSLPDACLLAVFLRDFLMVEVHYWDRLWDLKTRLWEDEKGKGREGKGREGKERKGNETSKGTVFDIDNNKAEQDFVVYLPKHRDFPVHKSRLLEAEGRISHYQSLHMGWLSDDRFTSNEI